MWDAWRDLVLGSCCVPCGAPGRMLCPACEQGLPLGGRPAWPTPTPPGLALPMAAGDYDGTLKALVVAHKERGLLALARPLGQVLASVLQDLAAAQPRPPERLVLVPVPSRPAVVRARGHDPMLRVARCAAGVLRAGGTPAGVRRLLVPRGTVRDQAGLGAAERATNLAGSMRCRRADPRVPGTVVVVDDVLTTGSTAREAQRALEAGGLDVAGVAVVAATRRRDAQGMDGRLPVSGTGD